MKTHFDSRLECTVEAGGEALPVLIAGHTTLTRTRIGTDPSKCTGVCWI